MYKKSMHLFVEHYEMEEVIQEETFDEGVSEVEEVGERE